MAKITRTLGLKEFTFDITPFRPCITDGSWLVARYDFIYIEENKQGVYFFGTDGTRASLYNASNPNLLLEGLAYDTLIKHLEKNEFKSGEYRFEFDGQKFHYCEIEPAWANYDCGTIED